MFSHHRICVCVCVFSGPAIPIQNITNMCQAFRHLCLNGRCIPMQMNAYRCECNMGYKLDGRQECIGECVSEGAPHLSRATTAKKMEVMKL